jgi:hypothetical protein
MIGSLRSFLGLSLVGGVAEQSQPSISCEDVDAIQGEVGCKISVVKCIVEEIFQEYALEKPLLGFRMIGSLGLAGIGAVQVRYW